MTLKHGLRRWAMKAGIDLRRARDLPGARLTHLLRHMRVDLVVDVGANDGQYGDELRRFGYEGQICSFEPLPSAFVRLEQTSRRDHNWVVRKLALGARAGPAVLNVAGNPGGVSSSVLPMLPRHRLAAPDSGYVDQVEVEMLSLDEAWPLHVPEANRPFLKVDVQGLEASVLEGARTSLERCVGMQLEISLVPLYEAGLSLPQALETGTGAGMRLVQLWPGFSDPATGELLQVDGVFARPAAISLPNGDQGLG